MSQDQRSRALRSVFFAQTNAHLPAIGPFATTFLDESISWSADRRFKWARLEKSKTRAQLRSLQDLFFDNLRASRCFS